MATVISLNERLMAGNPVLDSGATIVAHAANTVGGLTALVEAVDLSSAKYILISNTSGGNAYLHDGLAGGAGVGILLTPNATLELEVANIPSDWALECPGGICYIMVLR